MGLDSLDTIKASPDIDAKNLPEFRGQIVNAYLHTHDWTRPGKIKDKMITTVLKTTKVIIMPSANTDLYESGKWRATTDKRCPSDAPQEPTEHWCVPVQFKDKNIPDDVFKYSGDYYPLAMDAPFILDINDDHVAEFTSGKFIKLSGLYVEKTKSKGKDDKNGDAPTNTSPEKRSLDEIETPKESENAGKKMKSGKDKTVLIPAKEMETKNSKKSSKKPEKSEVVNEKKEEFVKPNPKEEKKVPLGVVDPSKVIPYRESQMFISIRAQTYKEDLVPLMDEEDRRARHLELLVPEITDENARMMDMVLSGVQKSMKKPLYTNILSNEESNFTFYVPAGNTYFKPYIQREKDSTEAIVNTDKIYPLSRYGRGSANGLFNTMKIDQLSHTPTKKVNNKEVTFLAPKMRFILLHEEVMLEKDQIPDKITRTTPKFYQITVDATLWRDKVPQLFGMWDFERVIRIARVFVPGIAISGGVNAIKENSAAKISSKTLDPGSPLFGILDTGGNATGKILGLSFFVSLAQSALEKDHYECGLYYPESGNHLRTLMCLMVDDELIHNFQGNVANLDQNTIDLLFFKNLKNVGTSKYTPDFKLLAPNDNENMMHHTGGSVVCHREYGKIDPWNGISHGRVILGLDKSENDNSWKQGGEVEKLYSASVIGTKNLKTLQHENWLFSNPRQAKSIGKTNIPAKNVIVAQNLILFYHIQFAKILSRFKKINNTTCDAVVDAYEKLATKIHGEIVKEFGIDLKVHRDLAYPDDKKLSKIYDILVDLELNLFRNNIPLECDTVDTGLKNSKEVSEPKHGKNEQPLKNVDSDFNREIDSSVKNVPTRQITLPSKPKISDKKKGEPTTQVSEQAVWKPDLDSKPPSMVDDSPNTFTRPSKESEKKNVVTRKFMPTSNKKEDAKPKDSKTVEAKEDTKPKDNKKVEPKEDKMEETSEDVSEAESDAEEKKEKREAESEEEKSESEDSEESSDSEKKSIKNQTLDIDIDELSD